MGRRPSLFGLRGLDVCINSLSSTAVRSCISLCPLISHQSNRMELSSNYSHEAGRKGKQKSPSLHLPLDGILKHSQSIFNSSDSRSTPTSAPDSSILQPSTATTHPYNPDPNYYYRRTYDCINFAVPSNPCISAIDIGDSPAKIPDSNVKSGCAPFSRSSLTITSSLFRTAINSGV